jgi:hypothetical protein
MDKVYYTKIGSPTTGLSRQIFNLVISIIDANKKNIKMVAVDNFTFQHSEIKAVPVSIILDLEKLNYTLSRRYGIYVYDKNFLHFELRNIFYGVPNRDKNVTKEILDNFCDENDVITVPSDISLNPITGDPFIGVAKRLLVNYTVKYKTDERYNSFSMEEFAGCLKEDLVIDYNVDKANYVLNETPLTEVDKHLFDYLLKHITFTERYINAAEEFIDFINIKDKKSSKINVLHLRLEEDVTSKFSNVNEQEDYIKNLEDKYIEEIKKNIEKTDDTLILSYSLNNRVLAFLKENEYKFYLKEKDIAAGREINAIIDLIMSKYCNNVFIGNFNENKMTGSCFSCYILHQLPSYVNKVNIDL